MGQSGATTAHLGGAGGVADSWLATVDSGADAKEREDRRLAIKRIVWIGGVIAWPLFGITDYLDASFSHRPEILGPLLWMRAAGMLSSLILLYVLRKPNLSRRVLTACDVLGFTSYSFLTSLGAIVMGGFGVNVCLGIMIIAFMRASLLPSHWSRAFVIAMITLLVLPATALVAAAIDARVRAEWLAPGKLGPLIYSIGVVMAGIAVGSAGCHMVWRTRRQVFKARKLGKYRLKARIGSGSMGDVWLARQDPLGRDVAVKVLRKAGNDDDGELRRRFAREAKAASLLRHPNTIRVIEYGASDDGSYFIAMELLDGVDLATLVTRSGPLPAWRAIRLAIQACGSLAEAHHAGIVHRDIKPANLFVTKLEGDEDVLKLLDFGIAHMADQSVGMTEVGTVFGSPAYMAPEACRGERADARTDIYSLGAVLYFMLTGAEMFAGKSVADTIMSQLKNEPKPPSERLAGTEQRIPADLERIVMRCLSKDRSKRFQSAEELEDALRTCADFRASLRGIDVRESMRRKATPGGGATTGEGPVSRVSSAIPSSVPPPIPPSVPPSRPPSQDDASAVSTTAAAENRRAAEVEETRLAMLRLAWIALLLAWPFFIVTDLFDALFSHQPRVLVPLLALRLGCILISILQILVLRRPNRTRRVLTVVDVAAFVSFAFLVSLEPVLLPGFEDRALLGLMIVAFMRASLLPSHWSRAFAVATLAILVLPVTLLVVGLRNPAMGAAWLDYSGSMAYSLGQIIAAVAMGSAASHMTWRAQREVLEARKLGQYRLKARLGSGATGDVWLARQDALDRDVALKVLRTRGTEDAESLRRFAREAKAASMLRHPNTIRVIEYGASDDGVYFMAMELLDGKELEKLVRAEGPLPGPIVVHLAIQACGSLSEAHQRGIIHRDIKPANLFVTRVGDDDYFIKLLDFGIAQMVEGDRSSTMTEIGALLGTPAYMSPEACCGEPTDARSDIYSFGAVMYFMLTGSDIFPDKTFAETLMAHLEVEPESISKRLEGTGRIVSADLERIVLRCLSKDPRDRFASARELEEALRACVEARGDAPRAA